MRGMKQQHIIALGVGGLMELKQKYNIQLNFGLFNMHFLLSGQRRKYAGARGL